MSSNLIPCPPININESPVPLLESLEKDIKIQKPLLEEIKEFNSIIENKKEVNYMNAIYEHDSPSKKREKLNYIFEKYCEKSNESIIPKITSRGFIKLLKDSELIDKTFTTIKAELIFFEICTQKEKKLNFEQFLSSLIKTAEIKNPSLFSLDQKKAVNYIFQKLPCEQELKEESKIELANYSISIYDEEVKLMLNSVYYPIKEIYNHFFFNRINQIKTLSGIVNSFPKLLISFLREFNLNPQLINKAKAIQLFNAILNNEYINADLAFNKNIDKKNIIYQEIGTYFPLSKFFVYLSFISYSIFEGEHYQYSNAEKLLFLLTKMELSINTYINKDFNTHSSSKSLIPPHIITSKLIKNNPVITISKAEKITDLQKDKMAIDLFIDKLQRLFMWYCSMGQSNEVNKMSMTKFLKFLKDSRILKTQYYNPDGFISIIEAEILYYKVICHFKGNNVNVDENINLSPLKSTKLKEAFSEDIYKQSRLELNSWIYSLSLISSKKYPNIDPEKALLALIEKYILPIYEREMKDETGANLITKMIDLLQEEEIGKLLENSLKILLPYFNAYADKYGLMNYKSFFEFCKDFGIFPDICSKLYLNKSFYSLSFISNRLIETSGYNTSESKEYKLGQEYLDSKLFIEAIAICALISKNFDEGFSNFEKILYLIEKLMQSPGIVAVRKKLGKSRMPNELKDPLIKFKEFYPDLFKLKSTKAEVKKYEDIFKEEESNN